MGATIATVTVTITTVTVTVTITMKAYFNLDNQQDTTVVTTEQDIVVKVLYFKGHRKLAILNEAIIIITSTFEVDINDQGEAQQQQKEVEEGECLCLSYFVYSFKVFLQEDIPMGFDESNAYSDLKA